MEVHLKPELEKKLNDLAAMKGKSADELAQDAIAGMVDEQAYAAADYQRAQEAAARIRELQKHVEPDPEGCTVKDYINFGRP
jgi:predicted DNA-binding protein